MDTLGNIRFLARHSESRRKGVRDRFGADHLPNDADFLAEICCCSQRLVGVKTRLQTVGQCQWIWPPFPSLGCLRVRTIPLYLLSVTLPSYFVRRDSGVRCHARDRLWHFAATRKGGRRRWHPVEFEGFWLPHSIVRLHSTVSQSLTFGQDCVTHNVRRAAANECVI